MPGSQVMMRVIAASLMYMICNSTFTHFQTPIVIVAFIMQSEVEHDLKIAQQRQKQLELIGQLKSQLEDLETYAYEVWQLLLYDFCYFCCCCMLHVTDMTVFVMIDKCFHMHLQCNSFLKQDGLQGCIAIVYKLKVSGRPMRRKQNIACHLHLVLLHVDWQC